MDAQQRSEKDCECEEQTDMFSSHCAPSPI
jgi:hypothetical protein